MHRLVAIVILLACAGCSAASELEKKAKEAVRYDLKDPDSAQFREIQVYLEKRLVCGEVNSRNSYGAYAGFEPFTYDDGRVSVGQIEKACTNAIVENTIAILSDLKQMKLREPKTPERDKEISDIEAQIVESQASLTN